MVERIAGKQGVDELARRQAAEAAKRAAAPPKAAGPQAVAPAMTGDATGVAPAEFAGGPRGAQDLPPAPAGYLEGFEGFEAPPAAPAQPPVATRRVPAAPAAVPPPPARASAPDTLPATFDAAARDRFVGAEVTRLGLTGNQAQQKQARLLKTFRAADLDGDGVVNGPAERQALAKGLIAGAQADAIAQNLQGRLAEQATAIDQAGAKAKQGNVVSRGFNSLLNVFNGNLDQMDQARNNAVRVLRNDLPKDLERYNDMVAEAGGDDTKLKAAQDFLDGSLAKADVAGKDFAQKTGAFQQGNKFWSGLAADVGAGLLVLGGAAIAITGFGAPIGAGMIAAGFAAGGALTVGGHALLDNQYDLKKEGLGNFLVGGIGAAATVATGGLAAGATQTLTRMAVRQGVIGAGTSLAGAAAQEQAAGWQNGWGLRLFTATAIGGTTGAVVGAGSAAIAQKLVAPGMSALAARSVNVALSTAGGATGAGLGAVANEGMQGFAEGWQDRVLQQIVGGGLAGLANAFGPDLHARNQALLTKQAEFKASPRGQAVETLRQNLGDLDSVGVKPGTLEPGVEAVSPRTRRALELALGSEHGSIDAKGAANVEHLSTVLGGVLERAAAANGGKPLNQKQVDRLALETVMTDVWAKGNSAADLADFKTAPTNAGDTAGEIFAHLKAEAKKAIAAPPGSALEALINQRIEEGKLNPGLGFDPAFKAAAAASGLSEPAQRALLIRVNKNFLNVTPAMLGTWVHGVPSFDAVAQIVRKGGGSATDARQVYESVLGHHMSGFIANGFARGNLSLDFQAMVKQGHLDPVQATRLENLYTSATELAVKWRPVIDKITNKGQPGADGQPSFTLTARQREAYAKSAADYKAAINDLPEAVRSQLLNDDQRQFTAQGLPKWLGMMQGMKQPKTMGDLVGVVYREPLQSYLLENFARGSEAPFIANASGPAAKLGLTFDKASMSFRPDAAALPDLARRIQADPALGAAARQALPAGAPAADVVAWFRAQPPDVGTIMRLVNGT